MPRVQTHQGTRLAQKEIICMTRHLMGLVPAEDTGMVHPSSGLNPGPVLQAQIDAYEAKGCQKHGWYLKQYATCPLCAQDQPKVSQADELKILRQGLVSLIGRVKVLEAMADDMAKENAELHGKVEGLTLRSNILWDEPGRAKREREYEAGLAQFNAQHPTDDDLVW